MDNLTREGGVILYKKNCYILISNETALTDELKDYKFFCFDGKVRCFKIDYDRFVYHRANYYDAEANLMPFGEQHYPSDPDRSIEMPTDLKLMEELAERLSEGLPFVRVDFYDVNGRVYFGEITFYPTSGFGKWTSEEWNLQLGSWINLPRV